MTKRPIPSHRAVIDEELKRCFSQRALTDAEWRQVELDDRHEDAYDTADRIRTQRLRRQPMAQPPGERDESLPTEFASFVWARSLLAAADAADDPGVIAFRADVLGGQLLPLDSVWDWVHEQRRLDGPATEYARHVVPQGWREHDPVPVGAAYASSYSETLSYSAAGEPVVHYVPVSRDGVLYLLRQLSERLAPVYGWQQAQASTFVLTGYTPVVSMLRMTTPRIPGPRQRVVLDVDPDVPPELVAAAFRRARSMMLGPRARPPSLHGSELVVHAAERPGVEPRGLWRQWNDAHPERPYLELTAFRQALRDARRRVLGHPRRQR
jgi:hypothetical protein